MGSAIILSAGLGSRLGELTKSVHKSQILIGTKSIVHRQMDELLKTNILHLVFVVGYQNQNLKEHLLAHPQIKKFNVEFVENKNYATSNTAQSLYLGLNHIQFDSCWFLDGDLVLQHNKFKKFSAKQDSSWLAIDSTQELDDEAMKASFEASGRIYELGKKIPPKKLQGEFIGLGWIKKTFCELYKSAYLNLAVSEQKRLYYEDIFSLLLAQTLNTLLQQFPFSDWVEVDTPEDLARAHKLFSIY